MSLCDKNADNCLVECANVTSLRLTRAYEAAAESPTGVGDLDVGARLQPFFSYSEEEMALFVASKDVVDASGPLPLYMTMWIAGQRWRRVKLRRRRNAMSRRLTQPGRC
jgi:hypothetical protein